MVNINLLPWREMQRKKKFLMICLSYILTVLFIIFCLHVYYQHQLLSIIAAEKKLIRALNEKNNKQLFSQKNAVNIFDVHQFFLNNVPIAIALQMLAKSLRHNIIISPSVKGTITLHVDTVPAQQIFNMILLSHNLAKINFGDTWVITTKRDWMQHLQEQFKLQDIQDTNAPLVTKTWQIQYAKAEDIAHLIQDGNHSFLSKRGHISIDSRTNRVCVQEGASYIQQIKSLIDQVDVPVQQVLIDTHLVSIDSDFERSLGIQFTTNTSQSSDNNVNVNPLGYGLLVAKLADGSMLDVELHALEQQGHGEIISNPRLFTANQQMASIEAGEEIPYQEVSRSGATGVTFKKAVLSLKVIPQIMPNNQVLLQLQINQDKPSTRIILGVPAITTRQMSTNVLVKNGQTLVLGGIYEKNKEQAEQSIPFLGKIPVIGLLFQQHDTKENKRELLIFVRPKIISQNTGGA